MPVVTGTAFWLLGHGVSQSPSPAMQNAALRACGLAGSYSIRDVPPAELAGVLEELRAGAAAGANVTIPHKRAVAAACDVLEGDARVAGAVNTVVVEEGILIGANTDARGLELALRHDGLWPDPGAAVVLLGAGGAASAAALALLRSTPCVLAVAARRREAADELVAALRRSSCDLDAVDWSPAAVLDVLRRAPSSVLLNATPAPLAELPLDVAALPDGCTVVDLRYRPRPIDLVAAARDRGLRACDGVEMLLQQGMLSFTRWTGETPPYEAARTALREAVGA